MAISPCCTLGEVSPAPPSGRRRSAKRIVTMDSVLDASRGPRMTKSFLPRQLLHRLVAMAGNQMIVDHADGLHEGIDNGRPNELEAALGQLLRHRARNGGLGWNLPDGFEAVDLRLPAEEIPQQV